MISDGFFPIFFVATVGHGGSIELGTFDKGARSIELHVRFDLLERDIILIILVCKWAS